MPKRAAPKTVYSSEHGRMCPHCGLSSSRCQCRANPRGASGQGHSQGLTNAAGDGVVRVGRSSKGRGGKTVTLIEGVQLPANELRDLARDLKRLCGTGGALKNEIIEIQGDQRDPVSEALEERGFRVKRKGG